MDPSVVTDPQPQPRQQGSYKKLYEKLKYTVWIVKVSGTLKGKRESMSLTAFMVSGEGHLLTSDENHWNTWKSLRIIVRPISKNDGLVSAEVVAANPSSKLCLLKIMARLAINSPNFIVRLGLGNLNVGDEVMSIGHPNDCVGTGLVGKVVYDCVESTDYQLTDGTTCRDYVPDTLTNTPEYMIMGHLFNKTLFDYYVNNDFESKKILHAKLPIIEVSGLLGGADGSFGAPIFNFKAELVGMFVYNMNNYDCCVHVSAIRQFLEANLKLENEGPSDGQSKEKVKTN